MYPMIKIDGKWVYTHRYVLEKKLGRKLLKNEVAHHIDENIGNFSENNLEVMTKQQHQKHHAKRRRHGYFVSFDKRQNRWHLYIRVNDKFKAFGYYDSIDDAIKAYKTGVRINRHDERKSRKYRLYFYSRTNKWHLYIKL